jgi:hypothetical protein
MKYYFYLRLNMPDGTWTRVGTTHEILWDNRDLIKASSGWLIVNREKAGVASDMIPRLHKGIVELKDSSEVYQKYELSHGLGTIKEITAFFEGLLQDCRQYPFAEVCGSVDG